MNNYNYSNDISVYIHIPFCKSKCHYCDFNSFSGIDEVIPFYFNALKIEITKNFEKLKNFNVASIFIGGGTPSFVESYYISEILELCLKGFNVDKNAEISIETNPGTLTYNKLISYKKSGINRISIGLQAWQNNLLKNLGRTHSVEEFVQNYYLVKKAGFENINIDLIFGIPKQSLDEWNETLTKVLDLNPTHISCYSLKIEDSTVFGERLKKAQITPISDELDREMYYLAKEKLGAQGFRHYEISNFARDEFHCKHNLVYWNTKNYLGFGAGAHSYFEDKRFNNTYNINEYINKTSLCQNTALDTQILDEKEKISEYIILGLRLTEGIDINDFIFRFNKNILKLFEHEIEILINKKLVVIEENKIKLSPLGLDLANEVFVQFI